MLAATVASAQQGRWTGSWGSAQIRVEDQEAEKAPLAGPSTIRQTVRLSVGGPRLRVRLSNLFGDAPLVIGGAQVALPIANGAAAVRADTARPLTFSGATSVRIPPGAELYSDPVALPITAGADLAVTLHLPEPPARRTGHPGSRASAFLLPGDRVADAAFAGAQPAAGWHQIADVEVEAPARTIVAIGDSITDGYGVTPDSNRRWTDFFLSRLRADPRTRNLGVVNAGIGGNRVLLDGIGPNLMARFDRDVIARSGATHAILLEGINDLGVLTRDAPATPQAHRRIVAEVTGAYRQLAERARAHGIKLIGGTLTPFVGNDYYHPGPETEADRQAINRFIRTSGVFDAVVDFDAALRDPANPSRLLPAYDSGDHLHPSEAGYEAMAKAVPLALFTGRQEAASADAPLLAITVDDMPVHGALPPGETHLSVTRRLIAAFREAGVAAPMGFLNAGRIGDAGDGEAVLRAWRAAGFPIANHAWSHPNLEGMDAPAFLADVRRNEPVLKRLMPRGGWRWFRYPFLSEGSDPAKRDAVRAGLQAGGYRVAAVTMDFGDYAWNTAYARCAARGDTAAIAALERSFMDAARVDALRARAMSRGAFGRDIPYVLLLHLGGMDARMMPRLLAMYRELGFRFTSLEKAQADPFYRAAEDLSLPGPSPRLDAAATAAGVPVPPRAPLPDERVCAG
ncbi:hypothetical protein CKY28_16585 [Sphingomonas lenta]|uniref:Chitooligosaccharide deacetylase n=2 Tax=Sphingomonas lenta TaxID=1141887 RepID=A0A2A2SC38_9SPHN|nr:hypothetical protein CKY28_16585 [Sphingomonas lenta]